MSAGSGRTAFVVSWCRWRGLDTSRCQVRNPGDGTAACAVENLEVSQYLGAGGLNGHDDLNRFLRIRQVTTVYN